MKIIGSEKEEIKEFFYRLNGNYSVVIESPDFLYAVVDKIRSIPLLYSINSDYIYISDNPEFLRDNISLTVNEENFAEFLVAGFVTEKETLYDEIFQIPAGNFLFIDLKYNDPQVESYFKFTHGNLFHENEDSLFGMLDTIYVNSFKRLIESVEKENKRIIVPLSSGLDSRIIVFMLKRLGVKDVICFSYGWKKSREAIISRHVAEKLGYEWHFVDYSPDLMYKMYNSDDMAEYLDYAGNIISLPFIQDFFAVKTLKAEGKIPVNSCIVPGHTGMIPGGRIPNNYSFAGDYDQNRFLRDNLSWHYNMWNWSGEDDIQIKNLFERKSLKDIDHLKITDRETCADALEYFDYMERQAKYVINSVRLYEYFGFSWKLPLSDLEPTEFFLRVPLDMRIGRQLYKRYAQRYLFQMIVPGFADIECTTNLSHQDKRQELERSILEKVKKYHFFRSGMSNLIPYCIYKRPFLSEIKSRISGINIDDLNQNLIRAIIRNNNKSSISKVNGSVAYLYLKNIILKHSKKTDTLKDR